MTRDEAVRTAAQHVADSLARQDARTPREAAVAALGPHATETQITDWCARYRPDAAQQRPA